MLPHRLLVSLLLVLGSLLSVPGTAQASTLTLRYPRPTLSATNVKRVTVASLPLTPASNGGNINGAHYLVTEDNPSQDLELVLPADRALQYPIRTVGFRKIVIIGGLLIPLEGTSALKFDGLHADSEVYLEGLMIDLGVTKGRYASGRYTGQSDAINTTSASGAAPTVTLQNLRIENVNGVYDWDVGWHGDAFQHQSGTLRMLRVHNVTATGNYQLFHVATASTTLLRTYFSNVNGRWNGVAGDAERPWMFFFRNGCTSAEWNQHTLENVWMEARSGYTVHAHHVRPASWQTACGAIDRGTYAEFRRQTSGTNVTPLELRDGLAADVLVSGRLNYGAPSGGDFAKREQVGLNYLGSQSSQAAVTGLTLFQGGQAVGESGLGALVDGATIDLGVTPSINVRADVNSATRQVRFLLSGAESLDRSESHAPLALQGDNGTTFNSWTPTVGSYTLRVTPYDAQGLAGPDTVVGFTVVAPPPANPNATVTKVALVRGGQSVDEYGLKLMTDGTVIDLSSTGPINMRADGSSEVDRIRFILTGPESVDRTESSVPYALMGDDSRVFNSWTPAAGDYLLRLIPYDSSGAAGPETALHFTVQP